MDPARKTSGLVTASTLAGVLSLPFALGFLA